MNQQEVYLQINNFFKDLSFKEETHTYTVHGIPLKCSVSKLISDYGNKFNTQVMSEAVARKTSVPRESIVAKWDKEREDSIVKGNSLHYFAEEYLKDRTLKPITKQQELMVHFLTSLPPHIVILGSEIKMYHKRFLFGGTMDLPLYNTLTNKIIIADYKSNKDVHKNYKGQTLLMPFNHLLDTPLNKYQLQLSFYQILLQQITGIEVESRKVIWFKDSSYEIYDCQDYTTELLKELERNEK